MATVLITGASGGIGKDIAEIFAKHKYNLVLVARRKEVLDKLAIEIEQNYKVKVNYFDIDLSAPNSAVQLYDSVKDININLDVLVNNAGVGMYGDATEMDTEAVSRMLHLNVISLTELSLLFAQDMKKVGSGKILNISSTAAFQPAPYLSAYAASKSYVLLFSEARHVELKKYGITVTTVCPGPTGTAFAKGADMESSKLFATGVMSSGAVAQKAYEAVMRKKMTTIVGLRNNFLAASVRFFPRKWIAFISGKMMK